jgi:pimeloyl-ACP methyl ester carboxylesterase
MKPFAENQTIAGLNIRIRKGDPAKCIVMLHGIGSDCSSFDRLAQYLPQDATLVSWNAPGYGRSNPLENSFPQAADYASRLLDLVKVLGLKKITLLGHSLGTLIAVEFTALTPKFVDRLILLASAQGYRIKPGAPLPDKAYARLTDLAQLGPLAFAKSRAPRLLYRPEAQPAIRDAAIRAMAAINPEGYAQAVHMLSCGNLSGRAASLAVATLVLVGDKDQITPPAQSLATHDALENSAPDHSHHYREIKDAGHLLHQEKPHEVAAMITQFTGWNDPAAAKVQA